MNQQFHPKTRDQSSYQELWKRYLSYAIGIN